MTKKTRRHAFTVVELVIVIAVIAILAAVLIPTYANLVKKANEATALVDAKNAVTEMLANMLSTDDASDILVISKKGNYAYINGYSAKEGRIVEYKDNPIDLNTNITMLTDVANPTDFYNKAKALKNQLLDASNGALKASTDEISEWRDTEKLNGEGGVVEQLGFKRDEMVIFADIEIVVEKFETHTHTWDKEWTFDSTNHWHVCTSCGATDSKIAHSYTNGVCVCGKVNPNPSTHTHDYNKQNVAAEYQATPATCEAPATYYYSCACGEKTTEKDPFTYGNALGHSWDAGKVTKEASCTEAGEKTFTCTRCPKTKTETIAATGHSYDTTTWKSDDNNHWNVCTKCGATTGNAAHTWKETVKKQASCEKTGVREKVCTVCGKNGADETIPATGHTWGDWKVTAATCTENGSQTRTCSKCSATETKPGDKATGHKWGEWTIDANTYKKTRKCSVCNTEEELKLEDVITAANEKLKGTTPVTVTDVMGIIGKELEEDIEYFAQYMAIKLDSGSASTKGEKNCVLWDSVNNVFCFTDNSAAIKYVNEDGISSVDYKWKYWKIVTGKEGYKVSPVYSNYLASGYVTNVVLGPNNTTVGMKTGLDVGTNEITKIYIYDSYQSNNNEHAKNPQLIIRTIGENVEIEIERAKSVTHYGTATNVKIVNNHKSTSGMKYYEKGTITGSITVGRTATTGSAKIIIDISDKAANVGKVNITVSDPTGSIQTINK